MKIGNNINHDRNVFHIKRHESTKRKECDTSYDPLQTITLLLNGFCI